MFREGICLNKEEPPHVLCGELLVCTLIHGESWGDIHQANFLDIVRLIETHPMRHARAAVMGCYEEAFVTVMTHYLDLILRHGAKRVVLVPFSALRFARFAV